VSDQRITLDGYPRAQRSIARSKGIGGLACFAVVSLLSLRAGVPFFDSGLRALAAGVVGYTTAWFVAVQVWRHIALAEITRHATEALTRRQKIEEELEARRAESGTSAA
jgi:hypothetical protein